MSAVLHAPSVELDEVEVLLCDADGCLFPSEEPAFEASAEVTNRLLADLGVPVAFTPTELRRVATGKTFRATAVDLAVEHGANLPAGELEAWVVEERRAVTAHLGAVLAPDPAVLEPVGALGARLGLAVVSSSALGRLAACFTATGLDELFPPGRRFSAEDSLPVPTSKPDPAVYVLAGERLGVAGGRGLAVEDSVPGVRSAVAAGFPVIGNVGFVPAGERAERVEALRAAGAAAIVSGWEGVAELLAPAPPARPRRAQS